MKFNPESYEKELLYVRLKNHSKLEGELRFKNIRSVNGGIQFDCFNGREWKRMSVDSQTIASIHEDLRNEG